MSSVEVKIGVLAMQGAFREHVQMLNALDGVTAIECRTAAELENLDGLVLPGGESTTMGLVAERSGVLPALRDVVLVQKVPVFATCAGLIMLADKAEGGIGGKANAQPLIGGLRAVVDRNHFGTQLNSFETDITIDEPILAGEKSCRGLFIRAPAIIDCTDPGVKVLARLSPETLAGCPPRANKPTGEIPGECIVACEQDGTILAVSFHPELTADTRWHQYFAAMVRKAKAGPP